jgi:uncharacterized protein YidB (DUF937 family)
MANQEIRELASKGGIKLWQIADKLGINDGNLSRKLRHELPEVEKERVIRIIDELKREA